MLIAQLHALLTEVRDVAGTNFTGVGVLVTSDPGGLPIAPLGINGEHGIGGAARDVLAAVSRVGSRQHDGFHVLSPDLRILLLSQYFAAPILPGVVLDSSRSGGARYATALFGSAVPGVLATGVATTNYGVAVFDGGIEVETSS